MGSLLLSVGCLPHKVVLAFLRNLFGQVQRPVSVVIVHWLQETAQLLPGVVFLKESGLECATLLLVGFLYLLLVAHLGAAGAAPGRRVLDRARVA